MTSDEPTITFPQVARLELDQLLEQLIDRAQDVLVTQGRLRGLLAATRTISSDLDLPVLLRRITEAACELVGARYGALGIIGPGGGLSEFITVGVEEETARLIGHLPRGAGLLGQLIRDPRPLRLDDVPSHPASVGLPPGHPPMGAFVGVPLRVRGEAFGNLYLCGGTAAGEETAFTAEDEELLVALASAAGVAIDNARLFDLAARRQRWLEASAAIVRDLVAATSAPLALIATQARSAADADLAVVVQVDDADADTLRVVAVDGVVADRLLGSSWRRGDTLAGAVIAQPGDAVFVDAAAAGLNTSTVGLPSGPAMMVHVPLLADRPPALLVLLRRSGSAVFSAEDLGMARDFTGHVALALELGRAQEDRRRLALVEDRDRIARDLHDHVVQELFASGLRLSALAGRTAEPATATTLRQVVEAGDQTIRAIRSTIYALGHAERDVELHALIVPLVGEFSDLLGFSPGTTFDVAPGAVVAPAVAEHVGAVVRELLSNCARHARATQVGVHVELSSRDLTVTVTDDGVGTGTGDRRSGLANLEQRAVLLGGRSRVTSPLSPAGRGTRVVWRVPTTP